MKRDNSGHNSRALRVVVVDPDHDELVLSATSIASAGMAEIVAESTSLSMTGTLIDRHDPDFVFLSLSRNHNDLNQTIARIRKSNSRCRVVVMGEHPDSDEILLCFRAGADEFLVKPLEKDELATVFERLDVREETPAFEEGSRGMVAALFGSRGGCGVTSTACNLAAHIKNDHKTVLVDFHFGQGDLSVHADVNPQLTLSDISESSERLDATLVDSITVKHKNGLHYILQSHEMNASFLQVDEMLNLIRILRGQYDYVLLDIGTDPSLALILAPQIDRFLLLMRQDLPSLTLAQRKMKMLEQADVERNRIMLVLNSYSKRSAIGLRQAVKVVGREDIALIRDDEETITSAINQGIPVQDVSRWSKAGSDLKKLADQVMRSGGAEEAPKAMERQTETALQSLPRLSNSVQYAS